MGWQENWLEEEESTPEVEEASPPEDEEPPGPDDDSTNPDDEPNDADVEPSGPDDETSTLEDESTTPEDDAGWDDEIRTVEVDGADDDDPTREVDPTPDPDDATVDVALTALAEVLATDAEDDPTEVLDVGWPDVAPPELDEDVSVSLSSSSPPGQLGHPAPNTRMAPNNHVFRDQALE